MNVDFPSLPPPQLEYVYGDLSKALDDLTVAQRETTQGEETIMTLTAELRRLRGETLTECSYSDCEVVERQLKAALQLVDERKVTCGCI